MAEENDSDRDDRINNDAAYCSTRLQWQDTCGIGCATCDVEGRGGLSGPGYRTGLLARIERDVECGAARMLQQRQSRGSYGSGGRNFTQSPYLAGGRVNLDFAVQPGIPDERMLQMADQRYSEFLARRNGGIPVSAWHCSCQRCIEYEEFLQGLERHVPHRDRRKTIVQKIFKITKSTRVAKLEDKFKKMTLGSGSDGGTEDNGTAKE